MKLVIRNRQWADRLSRVEATALVSGLAPLLAPVAWSHSTSARPRPPLTVQAKIHVFTKPGAYDYTSEGADFELVPRLVTFSPDLINTTTVNIAITNSDLEAHVLEIDGKYSRIIGASGRALRRVTFHRVGVYSISINTGDDLRFSGSLKVIK
jgi:hypothetical protein